MFVLVGILVLSTQQPAQANKLINVVKYSLSPILLPIRLTTEVGKGVVSGVGEAFFVWQHLDLQFCRLCRIKR